LIYFKKRGIKIRFFNRYSNSEELLGKIARIESTVNFLYDNYEFNSQGLNLIKIQEDLIRARATQDFNSIFFEINPKVTVIIPVSRPLNIACKAIESVLTQTHTNFELILVTESSRPDLNEWVSHRKDERIIIKELENVAPVTGKWSHWASSGGRSRTAAMKVASGDFITFLDDDDIMLPIKISRCVEFAQLNKLEILGHHESGIEDPKGNKLRINKLMKTRKYHSGSVDILGLGNNVIFLHKFFGQIEWPKFNYKNLRGNDTVFIRMLFELNPKFSFLPEVLTLKNERSL
jgi:glycosyltransferase involved in cell wall biosynthesis